MLEKSTYVERVLIVLNPDGSLRGAQQERLETITEDGQVLRAVYLEAEPLSESGLSEVIADSAAVADATRLLSEVAALTAQVAQLTSDIASLTADTSAASAALSAEIATLQSEKGALQQSVSALSTALSTEEQRSASLRSEVSATSAENVDLLQDIISLRSEVQIANAEISSLSQEKLHAQQTISKLTAETTTQASLLSDTEFERDTLRGELVTCRAENETLRARIEVYEAAQAVPDDLYGYANWKRRTVAYGGAVLYPGVVVDTSPEGQAMLTGVIESIERGYVTAPIDFKTGAGWMKVDLTALNAVATAVARHVQASFSAQSDIDSKIGSGEITTKEEIDLYAWPPNA